MEKIKRKLIVESNGEADRLISQDEVLDLTGPIIILGEPGSGKSVLCGELAQDENCVLVSAGKLLRTPTANCLIGEGQRLIIDGLDEVASNATGAAVDNILCKLVEWRRPRFILTCRSADWQGASYRTKIKEDYDAEPKLLNISPLSQTDAEMFLGQEFSELDASNVIASLYDKGLVELYSNPLSLRLLGEACRDTGTVPESRVAILEQSCCAMLQEKNSHHHRDNAGLSSDDLLNCAGAISALILLTGNRGVFLGGYDDTPNSFVHISTLEKFENSERLKQAVKTRLFFSDRENCLVPIHRAVAEYLGARWLAAKLKEGISARRLFSVLHYEEGVPTSLRGIHAWLAHFSSSVAGKIIKADPYGVIRYGDGEGLTLPNARLLLRSVVSLSEEDPYFRSEDWRSQSVASIARMELKDDILAVLRNPKRRFHLSSLLLNAITGSDLAREIASDLHLIMMEGALYYGERSRAMKCLMESKADICWPAAVGELLEQKTHDAAELVTSIIKGKKGEGFTSQIITESILQDLGVHLPAGAHARGEGGSSAEVLPRSLPADRLAEVLDLFCREVGRGMPDALRYVEYGCKNFIEVSLIILLEQGFSGTAEQIWPWLKALVELPKERSTYGEDLTVLLSSDKNLRRNIITRALSDGDIGENIRMRAFELDSLGCGLSLTFEDILFLLSSFSPDTVWTEQKKKDWKGLVNLSRTQEGIPESIQQAVAGVVAAEGELRRCLNEACVVTLPEWRKEQERRKKREEEQRRRRFAEHRASYLPEIEKMQDGMVPILCDPAIVYMGYDSDFSNKLDPRERLEEWLGAELACAACDGFIAALGRDDLLSAEDIAQARAENKQYHAEIVIQCGLAEMIKRDQPIEALPTDVLMAALVSWHMSGGSNVRPISVNVGEVLENSLFQNEKHIEAFTVTLLEPQIKAGNEHIAGLYRVARDERTHKILIKHALRWLASDMALSPQAECELVDAIVSEPQENEWRELIRAKLSSGDLSIERRKLWLSAGFMGDFGNVRSEISDLAQDSPDMLWCLRGRIPDNYSLSLEQAVFIVKTFGDCWPVAERPPGVTSGDTNRWNATEFIQNAISKIGNMPEDAATDRLEELVSSGPETYRDYILHTLAQQRKLRRDRLYTAPELGELVAVFNAEVPATSGDLKAYLLDQLEELQAYLKGSDVNSLDVFYRDAEHLKPYSENTCRDRIIDHLRPRIFSGVNLSPETQMPDGKRADIGAMVGNTGVPIEIKGQWHRDVWGAANSQLDANYTGDWRAGGRGIYLVLWFGNIGGKNLPRHPEGLERPATPVELREMLLDRIPAERREHLGVVVLDLTKTARKEAE